MRLTRAQRDILWSDFRMDLAGRATGLGPFGVAHVYDPPQGDDVAAVTFSHSYLDRCTPITEARARKLDPALVAYMEQPE